MDFAGVIGALPGKTAHRLEWNCPECARRAAELRRDIRRDAAAQMLAIARGSSKWANPPLRLIPWRCTYCARMAEALRRLVVVQCAQALMDKLGFNQTQVVEVLTITPATLSRFLKAFRTHGVAGLMPGASTGRPPKAKKQGRNAP